MSKRKIGKTDFNEILGWNFKPTEDDDGNLRVTLPTFDFPECSIHDFEGFLEENKTMDRISPNEPLIYRSAGRGDVCNSRSMAFKLTKLNCKLIGKEVLWLNQLESA